MTPKELAELDLAVAIAEGMAGVIESFMTNPPKGHVVWIVEDGEPNFKRGPYSPTTDPVEAMRLLVHYNFALRPELSVKLAHTGKWECSDDDTEGLCEIGETPCIAICRAVIALHAANPQAGGVK